MGVQCFILTHFTLSLKTARVLYLKSQLYYSYILKVSYITLQAWQSAGSKGQQARGEAFDVMPDFLTTRTVARGINTPYR